jgi:hypothetical protein
MDQTQDQLPGSSTAASEIEAGAHCHSEIRIRLRHCMLLLLPLAILSTIAGYYAAGFESVWSKWLKTSTAQANSFFPAPALVSAPKPKAAKNDIEEISRLEPQQQAERLLDLAIQRPDPSLDLIRKNLDSWRGRLENNDHLFHLVLAALRADDPRVRTAAVEIDLAANHLEKSPESLARLMHQIQSGTDGRFLALWRLGALGNRGVEPATVLSTLLLYSRDANQQTRFWAVEGLAMLGTEESIDPLLSVLAHDPAPRVRESAACGLARSGLLTGEQRLAAVPQLLNLLDDDSLDSATQDLVYSALRSITGASFGRDPNAWRDWWAHHDRPEKPRSIPKGMLVA